MSDREVANALVALFEAKATDPDGRIRVEDLLSAAAAATGEACIAAAGEFDPEKHTFTPGAVVMSDRINAILCDNAQAWPAPVSSVFGIVASGALASGYAPADLPPLDGIFRTFASAVAQGGPEGWGFVPLSVPEDHRPRVQPLRQAYELRPAVRALFEKERVKRTEWPMACAFALVVELGRVKDAIDRGVALRIVLETVNGMAKTAPMTDEALRAAST